MKFNFHKNVSKIFDFLMFPRLYFSLKDEGSGIDEQLIKVMEDEYIHLHEHIRLSLTPYQDTIKKFYHQDVFSSYDFINILMHAYPIYTYQDSESYFNHLLNENPAMFKRNMIKALLTVEDPDKDDLPTLDETNATQYINALKIDAAHKWELLMLIQNPFNQLQIFNALLNDIKPFFDEQYQVYETLIENVGNDLAKRISGNTNETFKQLTYHAISYDFDEHHTDGALYVSFTAPYTLRFLDTDLYRIIWGIDMEYAFKTIHEMNDNQLTQRVKVFKALGDRTRYETLKLIAGGCQSIKDIASQLDVSSATISYHINEFLTSGILFMNREKKQKSGYQIDYDRLEEVLLNLKKDLKFE